VAVLNASCIAGSKASEEMAAATHRMSLRCRHGAACNRSRSWSTPAHCGGCLGSSGCGTGSSVRRSSILVQLGDLAACSRWRPCSSVSRLHLEACAEAAHSSTRAAAASSLRAIVVSADLVSMC
jgi:hypothetical protein